MAAAGDDAAPGGSQSFEVEVTFDVDEDTPLPDWSTLPGVSAVGAAERRDLDARYLDTTELALATAGYALRRRTGGPDAGWHLKGPRTGDGRTELGWPLGTDEAVPDAVAAAIAGIPGGSDAARLRPIARILNTRTAYALRGSEGVVAEFVDDRVTATDARTGAVRTWREWEIELGPAGPRGGEERAAFFGAVQTAVLAVGGRAASSDSKLARALGH